MRLSECLNSSDIDTLRKIADAYQFDCSKSSKNALMQEIMLHFNNRRFVSEAFDSIQDAHFREAVSQFMLDSRQEFSREEVLALVRRALRIEAQDAHGQAHVPKPRSKKKQKQPAENPDQLWMRRLLQEGWLYRLNTKGGRQFFFIPDDLRRNVRDYLSHNLQQRVQVAEREPIIYRDENLALVRDAMVFLQYVEKNDVRITKDGTIMKRKQQEIFALLEIKEEPLGNVSWRFGYGRRFHDYPDRFALLYDYCFNRELIVETPDGELLPGGKVKSWLQLTEKERAEDLFRFWRLLYRRPIPKLKLCIATLAPAAKDTWVHASSMNELLAPYVKDYYYDKAQTVMEQRIYNMLVHLGLLAHGQLATGEIVIKVTPLGRELLLHEESAVEEVSEKIEQHLPLILQPNFDLLVPIESFERIGWELEEVTDLIRVDTMRVHRITKSSVRRAFENGWTGETVLDFLKQETVDMVPGNVERMIDQWAAEYSRVKLYRAVVVECGDASMATDLKTLDGVAPHVRLELTDTHFLIGEQGVPALQQALQKMGYQADIVG
jgi:hypothetical protein